VSLETPTHSLFSEMQVVVEPLPRLYLRDVQTRCAISERSKEEEAPDQSSNDNTGSGPGSEQRLSSNALPDRLVARTLCDGLAVFLGDACNIGRLKIEDEFDQCTCNKCAGKVGWKVMVQEELTAHDEEWDIVGGPCKEEEAGAVVQSGASA
jgi:hypothetical protein